MFLLSQPIIRQMAVFSTMPDKFRLNTPTQWADANRGGIPTDSFLEGPVWDGSHLYVTDIPHGRIFRISQAGEWELITQYQGEPNGMKRYDDNHLIITDYQNGLMLLNIHSGQITPFLTRKNSESFKGVNDLTFDSKGNLYFTDQGQTGLHDPTGRVYRLSQDGRLDILLDNCPSPNGLILSLDEKVLFVAMTRGNCVWRVPLLADGSVSKVSQFFTSYGASGPDGLTIDSQGRILVANPGLGLVWVLNHKAEPVEVLTTDVGTSTTNLCYGGADLATLYVTESTTGTILTLPMTVAGVLPNRPLLT